MEYAEEILEDKVQHSYKKELTLPQRTWNLIIAILPPLAVMTLFYTQCALEKNQGKDIKEKSYIEEKVPNEGYNGHSAIPYEKSRR